MLASGLMLQPEVDWIVDLYIYLCRDTACSVSVRVFLVFCRDLILVSFLISFFFFYVFFPQRPKGQGNKGKALYCGVSSVALQAVFMSN